MSIYELGKEYLEQYDEVRKKIVLLRNRIKSGEETNLLATQSKLSTFCSMARDCKAIGDYLINYYNKGEK